MTTVERLSGLKAFLCSLDRPYAHKKARDEALNTEIGEIVIDTCYAVDTEKWETGIKEGEHCVIVEQYHNESSAKRGHKKYVKAVKEGQKNFKGIDVWNVED